MRSRVNFCLVCPAAGQTSRTELWDARRRSQPWLPRALAGRWRPCERQPVVDKLEHRYSPYELGRAAREKLGPPQATFRKIPQTHTRCPGSAAYPGSPASIQRLSFWRRRWIRRRSSTASSSARPPSRVHRRPPTRPTPSAAPMGHVGLSGTAR